MEPQSPNLRPFTIDENTFPPVGELVYMPVTPSAFYGLGSDEPYEVVGESFNQESISRFMHEYAAEAPEGQAIYAMLLHEHLNPFDHNAIRIDLFWTDSPATCGHLPRTQARIWAAPIDQAAEKGLVVAIEARVFGGTADKPNYGVWLGGNAR